MIQCYETDVFLDPIGMKVWEKRHQYAATKLSSLNCKKILDMGCNSGKLIQRLSRNIDFVQIDGVDIDSHVLETETKLNAKPDLIQDQYASKRDHQLVVNLYQGSALNKIQHLKDQNYDAITLIELIEHLQVEDIHLLEENIFAFLRPQYVIISTPNADFNVYFNFEEQGVLFRDDDHKFEWNQNQFINWAQSVSKRFGYKIVELTGVGEHKIEGIKNGYCSQIALFQKDSQYENYLNLQELYSNLQEGESHTVAKYLYPFESKEKSFNKEVIQCIRYSLHNSQDYHYFEDGSYSNYITLHHLMRNNEISNNSQVNKDFNKLMQYIQKISEFVVHPDTNDIANSFITSNYEAQMDQEEDQEDQQYPPLNQKQYLITENTTSTEEDSASTFSTPEAIFHKKTFSDQQLHLENMEFEEIIDY